MKIRAYIVTTLTGPEYAPVRRAVFAYDARDALVQAELGVSRSIPRASVYSLSPPLTADDWAIVHSMPKALDDG